MDRPFSRRSVIESIQIQVFGFIEFRNENVWYLYDMRLQTLNSLRVLLTIAVVVKVNV